MIQRLHRQFARPARIVAALVILLSLATTTRASEFSDDLKARRARAMERLGQNALLAMWSAPTARYSRDVDYEYRQDSNLYYLTGITQDNTMLVLMPGNQSRREILFIKPRDPAQEHWRGRSLSVEDARALTGIDTVLTTNQFEPFVTAMLSHQGFGAIGDAEASRFFDALTTGNARVDLLLDPDRGLNDPLTPPLAFARKIREGFVGFETVDATKILSDLRLVKTAYERTVLIKSFEISNAAQITGMRAAHPGAFEYEVKAAIEAVFRARGAWGWSYPSIVGSGPNTTILHYPEDDRQMQSGELLLVDAAANFQYMADDITRTYPVSGTYSQAQKDIYQIVLEAQAEGIKAARPGASLQAIHQATVDVIKAGLLKLGLITDAGGDQYRIWYTHGASHYIGIDVHDVGDRQHPLESGMAFTIEPGIYIRQSALDALARTAENIAFIDKVQAAVRKYNDIGVRIEDSFLLEDAGLRNLSAAVPKTVDAVEALIRTRK